MWHRLAQHQQMLQKMVLTPLMRQSLQLLGMPVRELNEYINEILEKNPCLKKESDYQIPKAADRPKAPVAQRENPREALLSQIRLFNLADGMLEIAEYLIYELDENGYLKVRPQEAAADLGVNTDEVEKALEIIKGMDPPGIGAADIRECLQLQLKRAKKENSLEYTIVTDFINELAVNDAKKIAKALKTDEGRITEAIKAIKKLNPRPASSLLSEAAYPVIPDMAATVKNNKVSLALNREWLPRLKLYNPYEDKLEIVKDPEVKEFLKNNMNAARGLMDNLKRREETMCRVANCIITFQADSLGRKKQEIKALTIKDVAKALMLHPSTVSRAVFQKYVQIGAEVIPLKALLSKGIQRHNDGVISKTAVKKKIELLVKGEDKSQPLSDEDIKERLKQEGIKIQRRTISKYRNSQRILPAYLRRKRNSP